MENLKRSHLDGNAEMNFNSNLFGEISKVGINFNGNLDDDELVKRAEIVKKSGINVIWIGEFEGFKDPFYVAELLADLIDFIGFGILSPLKRDCKEILKLLEEFQRRKRDFIVGIAPGRFENAKLAINTTLDCIKYLKKHLRMPVVAGCSSPLITRKSSQVADGILFNYVKPDFIRWIASFMEEDLFTAAYGPGLILDSESEFYESLLIASCIVISSEKFVKGFGLRELTDELRKIDFDKLIEIRHTIGTIRDQPEYEILEKHSAFLLENFTISGDASKVAFRIGELLKSCNHVILSDPFFRDDHSMESLKDLMEKIDQMVFK